MANTPYTVVTDDIDSPFVMKGNDFISVNSIIEMDWFGVCNIVSK